MCIFPHDRGFNYHKPAVLVVVCLLTALINAHIKELKDHANLANTKIIAARFLEIFHSRKLIGLFKAISIFLTSMEEVILLGLSGTTKSSLTWSSGGNTFSFCLNKDFGGTLGRELNVDFFLAGLLEVGELLWHLYTLFTWVPRSVISICSWSVWSAFSLKTLSPSKNFSNLSNCLLHFMHKTDEVVLSLLTGNPSTDDNYASIFCSLEQKPSNKLNFPYPDII